MIISIKSSIKDEYASDVSIERVYDDLTAPEALECFINAMIAYGYHADNVKQAVIEQAETYENEDSQKEDRKSI